MIPQNLHPTKIEKHQDNPNPIFISLIIIILILHACLYPSLLVYTPPYLSPPLHTCLHPSLFGTTHTLHVFITISTYSSPPTCILISSSVVTVSSAFLVLSFSRTYKYNGYIIYSLKATQKSEVKRVLPYSLKHL